MTLISARKHKCSIKEILRQYIFYSEASQTLQKEIEQHAHQISIEKNSYIFQKNSRSEYIALLGQGKARVYVVGDNGREVTLYHVSPGESCPINILSALLNQNIPAIAVAETESQAVIFRASQFMQWVSEHHVIRQYVLESISLRLVSVLTLMEDLKFRKLDQRLAEYLILQFSTSNQRPPVIESTHEKIAAELGSAREVISRLLREFERVGSIKLARGRIILIRESALHKLIEKNRLSKVEYSTGEVSIA